MVSHDLAIGPQLDQGGVMLLPLMILAQAMCLQLVLKEAIPCPMVTYVQSLFFQLGLDVDHHER